MLASCELRACPIGDHPGYCLCAARAVVEAAFCKISGRVAVLPRARLRELCEHLGLFELAAADFNLRKKAENLMSGSGGPAVEIDALGS